MLLNRLITQICWAMFDQIGGRCGLSYNDVFRVANDEFGSLINVTIRINIDASSEEIIFHGFFFVEVSLKFF